MCDDPFEGVTKGCHEPFVPAGEAVIAGVDGVEPPDLRVRPEQTPRLLCREVVVELKPAA